MLRLKLLFWVAMFTEFTENRLLLILTADLEETTTYFQDIYDVEQPKVRILPKGQQYVYMTGRGKCTYTLLSLPQGKNECWKDFRPMSIHKTQILSGMITIKQITTITIVAATIIIIFLKLSLASTVIATTGK